MTPAEAQETCKNILAVLRDNGMEINSQSANALLRYWNLAYLLGYYEGIRKMPRKLPSESSLTDDLLDILDKIV